MEELGVPIKIEVFCKKKVNACIVSRGPNYRQARVTFHNIAEVNFRNFC